MEILRYETLSSTNSELMELSKKNAKSWTVVWTSHQTHGKGYAGNSWKIEKDKNIAVSVLIKTDLDYAELIYYNLWVSNVLGKFLKRFSDNVAVKWPNDIILENKKVCGVLIETHKVGNELNILTGIGLNVNQIHFESMPKAGSIASETQQFFDLEEILSGLLTEMKNSFFQIEEKNWNEIHLQYNQYLFRRNLISTFTKDEKEFQGIILGVDERGFLVVENLDLQKTIHYQHKEIELKY